MQTKMIVMLLLAMLVGCSGRSYHFATLADAQQAQMIDKGWLPPNLPASTHDIDLYTEVDAGQGKGRLEMSAADLERFLAALPPSGKFEHWEFRCDRTQRACEFDIRY